MNDARFSPAKEKAMRNRLGEVLTTGEYRRMARGLKPAPGLVCVEMKFPIAPRVHVCTMRGLSPHMLEQHVLKIGSEFSIQPRQVAATAVQGTRDGLKIRSTLALELSPRGVLLSPP